MLGRPLTGVPGDAMKRQIFVAAIAALCAGCAQEPMAHYMGLGLGPRTSQSDSADASEGVLSGSSVFARRILTAIALEQVTGMKPDPQRLVDGN